MLRTINICLLLLSCVLCGCRTVPEGTPPERIVEIDVSGAKEDKVSLAEAVNMVSTELAVEVFSGRKGDIRIIFKSNSASSAVTRRLYHELKIFQPVKSVLDNADFILESNVGMTAGKNYVWQLKLKNSKNKVVWSQIILLKDGEKL